MKYLSLFSGIEAATVAWESLGWECVAVSEIEKFPCEVLKHHYPNVPNLGDVTKITEEMIKSLGHIDLIVFGSPCQDLSVAGKRRGLDGNRSGLFFMAIKIIQWVREHNGCRYALWENVPGAFSSARGEDFASVVREMAGFEVSPSVPLKGWGNEGVAIGEEALLEWVTLDAQWFGVAQRRRRVFALADFGDWYSRPPILLESESMRGDSAPRRETRKEVTEVAGTLTSSGGGLNRPAGNANELDFCIATTCSGKDTFGTLMANCGTKQWLGNQEALSGDYHVFALAGNTIGRQPENGGNGEGWNEDIGYTLTKADVHAVAFNAQGSSSQGDSVSENITPTLDKSKTPAVMHKMQVRRLMPIECERLQGFPDNYTNIPGATDSARYKALGNSMAVPVMHWIGQRINYARMFS